MRTSSSTDFPWTSGECKYVAMPCCRHKQEAKLVSRMHSINKASKSTSVPYPSESLSMVGQSSVCVSGMAHLVPPLTGLRSGAVLLSAVYVACLQYLSAQACGHWLHIYLLSASD